MPSYSKNKIKITRGFDIDKFYLSAFLCDYSRFIFSNDAILSFINCNWVFLSSKNVKCTEWHHTLPGSPSDLERTLTDRDSHCLGSNS